MSQVFTERPWQKPMIEIATRLDRCNIFAKPGMGKTSAALMALEIRSMVDDAYPVLAIGPKRVANSVWSSEVEKWAQFNHLRVARILGTQAERVAALNSKADIYTIHYGLLKWLVETLDGKWPFRTVIADESSRLKNTRAHFKRLKSGKLKLYVQGGSINAGYLARNALRTRFWTNLTGTPASNGLQNLYGQQWFVDYGAALGNSYSAFTNRWFYQRRGTSAEQAVFEPFDHAFDEITQRIKPNTISLDPRDWFNIQKPHEVDIMVDLPDKLMKQYREFHREAKLKLSEEKYITAVNAGVLTGKCLQFANGHMFDEKKIAHHIHDEKLDALDSLIENQNGAPLLLCYQYIPDREAIMKKFPFARLLPSDHRQKAVEDEWNTGRIPLLVVHPASAGHGLSLQHGGCDIAFFGTGWDAELYEQVIERLGPMRQMQSGYDRVVNVYRLLVRGTYDMRAADTVAGKITLQDAVMEAVR